MFMEWKIPDAKRSFVCILIFGFSAISVEIPRGVLGKAVTCNKIIQNVKTFQREEEPWH